MAYITMTLGRMPAARAVDFQAHFGLKIFFGEKLFRGSPFTSGIYRPSPLK
jgi:hypothetical protein